VTIDCVVTSGMVGIVPVTLQIPVKLSDEETFAEELFLIVHESIRLRPISNKAVKRCGVKFLCIGFTLQ